MRSNRISRTLIFFLIMFLLKFKNYELNVEVDNLIHI